MGGVRRLPPRGSQDARRLDYLARPDVLAAPVPRERPARSQGGVMDRFTALGFAHCYGLFEEDDLLAPWRDSPASAPYVAEATEDGPEA